MNRISLLIIVIICILNSCIPPAGQNKYVEEFYPDGMLKSRSEVQNGFKHGITKNFDEKGRLLSEAQYVEGVRNGWLVNYNPNNGKVITKAMIKNDIQEGPLIMYYQEGMLFRESNYVNGRVEGLVKSYWPDGKVKAEITFKMGMPGNDLKEYDKEGKQVQQPSIVVNNTGRNSISISLSDNNYDIDVFVAELQEGKFFLQNMKGLRVDQGVCTFDYSVARKKATAKGISFVVKAKTKYGNTLILQKWVKV